jgi:hypothetical protein
MSKQHIWKVEHSGTILNSLTGHCALSSESTDVKVQNIQMGNNVIYYIKCNYRTPVTLYTLKTWCVARM